MIINLFHRTRHRLAQAKRLRKMSQKTMFGGKAHRVKNTNLFNGVWL